MLAHSRQSGVLYINAELLERNHLLQSRRSAACQVGEIIGNDAVIHIIKNCNGLDRGVYKLCPANWPPHVRVPHRDRVMLEALREIDEERAANDGGYK